MNGGRDGATDMAMKAGRHMVRANGGTFVKIGRKLAERDGLEPKNRKGGDGDVENLPSHARLAQMLGNLSRSMVPKLLGGDRVSYEILKGKVLPAIHKHKLWPDDVPPWLHSLIEEDRDAIIPPTPDVFSRSGPGSEPRSKPRAKPGREPWRAYFLSVDFDSNGEVRWFEAVYEFDAFETEGPTRYTARGTVGIPGKAGRRVFRLVRLSDYLCTIEVEPGEGEGLPFACTLTRRQGDVFCGTWTGAGVAWQITAYRVFFSPRPLLDAELKELCRGVPIRPVFKLDTDP